MNKLIEFRIDEDSAPIGWVSENLPDYIKDVLTQNWDKTSSGLGDHHQFKDWVKG